MDNFLFGKTCEDVGKHRDIKIAMIEKQTQKVIARPIVQQWKIYE